MSTIWTVGHSTLSLEGFLKLVEDIDILADVRRFPGSRRYPHFSRASLEKAKPYVWFEELGGRRSGDNDRHPALRHKAFRSYAGYMDSPMFATALEELEELARSRKTAMMCAEAVWFRCHRRLISDVLVARGWEVLHLPGSRPHVLTPGVRVADGGVVYDQPVQ
jgi:uncharacterized protein (DUF488 family)